MVARTKASSKSTGIRKRQKEQRPGQILEAAFTEFSEKGYAGARVVDVARRVGVTKGTVYFYFPTKADLFKAVVRTHLNPILERIEGLSAEDPAETATNLLRRQIKAGYAEFVRSPQAVEFLRLMVIEGSRVPEIVDFYVNDLMGHGYQSIIDVLERGVKNGEFRANVLEKFAAFPNIILSPAMQINMMQLMVGDRANIDIDQYMEAHIDLVLNGLKA
ncbi:MAG TPA: TetR/AcrR family transcriptional regulator [Alphaproteobacteria bacterium]|nr:TetR/AcrR family transcriptional regulator [Alphaproteobacteria bacterium]